MQYWIGLLRAFSLRTWVTVLTGFLLLPLLEQAWVLMSGSASSQPLYLLVLGMLIGSIGSSVAFHFIRRTHEDRFLESPLPENSWPAIRSWIKSLYDATDQAVYFPRASHRLREQGIERVITALTQLGQPDDDLAEFYAELIQRQSNIQLARSAAVAYLKTFVKPGEISVDQVPLLLDILTWYPDLVSPYETELVDLLKSGEIEPGLDALGLLEKYWSAELLPELSSLYLTLRNPLLENPQHLEELLHHPDCDSRYQRFVYHRLRLDHRGNKRLTDLYTYLREELGPFWWERLLDISGRIVARLIQPRVLKPAAALIVFLLVVRVIVYIWPEGGAPTPEADRPLIGASESGDMAIQVMASRDSLVGSREVRRLIAAGYAAYLLPPRPNSRYYRIRVGRFTGKSIADSLARTMLADSLITEFYIAKYQSAGK